MIHVGSSFSLMGSPDHTTFIVSITVWVNYLSELLFS